MSTLESPSPEIESASSAATDTAEPPARTSPDVRLSTPVPADADPSVLAPDEYAQHQRMLDRLRQATVEPTSIDTASAIITQYGQNMHALLGVLPPAVHGQGWHHEPWGPAMRQRQREGYDLLSVALAKATHAALERLPTVEPARLERETASIRYALCCLVSYRRHGVLKDEKLLHEALKAASEHGITLQD